MDATGAAPSESDTGKGDDKSAVQLVADTNLPLEVGTVAIGDDGHISHSSHDRALHFRFTACGIDFEAEIASKEAPLRIKADLGKLPYSAESPEGRRLARSVLAATDRLSHGQILLAEGQDIVLQGELMPPSPRTPVSVIATAAALVLNFKPYVALLAEAVAHRRPLIEREDPENPQDPENPEDPDSPEDSPAEET